MKKILTIILIFWSLIIFGQKLTITYDYKISDYKIVEEQFIEGIIGDDWESWASPHRISTISPKPLNVLPITKENELYNIGVVFFNEGVISFNTADTTNSDTLYVKSKDRYIFYWTISGYFFERSYIIYKNKESLLALRHVYARLNKPYDFQKIEKLLKR